MVIQNAEVEDIPALLDLLRQVGQVHHLGRPDLFRPDAQKYDRPALEALLLRPDRTIFVAREGDSVLGYAFCVHKETAGDPVLAGRHTLYIDDLCVDAAHRRRGVGTALLAHVRAYARAQGFDDITLNVWAFNEDARAFYAAQGFTPQRIILEERL